MENLFDNLFKAWDNTTTLVFFTIFVPGFISMQVWRVLYPFEKNNLGLQIGEVLGFGAANYGLTYPVLHFVRYLAYLDPKHPHKWWLTVAFYLATFVIPMVTPFLVYLVRYTIKFGALNPTPKPWDYVFSEGKLLWVALELNGGELIGGKYGTHSFASSSPNEEQIYLEEAWEIGPDLTFKEALKRSAGVLVNGSEIKRMYFFK